MNTIESVIREIKGSANIGITTRTVPKLSINRRVVIDGVEKACPVKNGDMVEKIANVQGMIGFDYAHSCQREDIRRGGNGEPIEVKETWGHHETPAIVEHNGKKYLQIKIQSCKSQYFVNGVQIHKKSLSRLCQRRVVDWLRFADTILRTLNSCVTIIKPLTHSR